MAEEAALSLLENLPDEILEMILGRVPSADLAVNVANVSRRMRGMALHRSLWKHACFSWYVRWANNTSSRLLKCLFKCCDYRNGNVCNLADGLLLSNAL